MLNCPCKLTEMVPVSVHLHTESMWFGCRKFAARDANMLEMFYSSRPHVSSLPPSSLPVLFLCKQTFSHFTAGPESAQRPLSSLDNILLNSVQIKTVLRLFFFFTECQLVWVHREEGFACLWASCVLACKHNKDMTHPLIAEHLFWPQTGLFVSRAAEFSSSTAVVHEKYKYTTLSSCFTAKKVGVRGLVCLCLSTYVCLCEPVMLYNIGCFRQLSMIDGEYSSPVWFQENVKFPPVQRHSEWCVVHELCALAWVLKPQWSALLLMFACHVASCLVSSCAKETPPLSMKQPLYHLFDMMKAREYWWRLSVDFEAPAASHRRPRPRTLTTEQSWNDLF